ncbi:DMT family transporter [Haloferula chungangensis]|uniref:DMT family transporter n=1 Tax=Haloferula chungangensis TaxID=1048331 RepID=A0ABW2L8A7_9BACT
MNPYLQLHLLVVLLAMTAILGRLMTITAPVIVTWRTFLAALAAFAWVVSMRRKRLWFGWRKSLTLLGIGVILGLHWLAFFASVKISNVSVCLVGLSTISLFTAFTEPLLEKRPIRSFEVLLGIIVLGGIFLIAGFERGHLLGLSLGILSAFLAAIFPVLNRRYVNQGGDPLTMVGWEMVGACAISLGLLPWIESEGYSALLSLHGLDWLWMLILALVCTVFGHGLHIHLLRRISAYACNLAINFEPIYGIAIASLLFHEHREMHPAFYLGAAAILVANLLHPWFEKRSKLP